MTDGELKRSLSSLGFNIVAMSPDKFPVNGHGGGLEGPANIPHIAWEDIPQHVKDAERWGIAHSTDKSKGFLFLDWDHGRIPDRLKKMMSTYRNKGGQESYHGIVKIDASKQEIQKFANKVKKLDCGLEVFPENQRLAIMGEYSVNGSSEKSAWRFLGDLHRNDWEKGRIKDASRSDLSEALAGFAPGTGQIPAGRRHTTMMIECFKIVKKLPKEDRNFENVYERVIKMDLEGREEYLKGGKSHGELEKMINHALEHGGDNPSRLAFDCVAPNHRFAHIKHTSGNGLFNCWIYEGNAWHESAAETILGDLLKLDIDDLNPNSRMAQEMARQIASNAETCLQVEMDWKYSDQRMYWIIDSNGKYFDLSDGRIRDIDPARQFFENRDVRCPIKECEYPVEYVEFLQNKFGDGWEIVRDHVSGIFLHAKILGSRPKMLTIVGKTNSGKSFFAGLIAGLFDDANVSNKSMREMDSDSVFGPATIINKMFNYHEEMSPKMPENYSVLKDLITKIGGFARQMRTTKAVMGRRWPRWMVFCNRVSPIAEDDEDDSIFDRQIYLEMQESKSAKDWRKILDNDAMREKILWYHLQRAYEIMQNPKSIRTQSKEEAKERYEKLRRGDLEEFIEKYCITNEGDGAVEEATGVGWVFFKKEYRKKTETNVSDRELRKTLEDLGYEKARAYCMEDPDGSLETYQLCHRDSGTQKTLIMGLKWRVLRQQKLDK